VVTVGAATFSASDIVQFSDTDNDENDGLYEVLTHAANLLTIRGVGTTAAVEDFTDNQFVANASDSATITKVTVSVMRAGTDGIWETANGSATGFSFSDLLSDTTGVSPSGAPVDNQLAIWTGSNTIEGDSDLTFDGLNLTAGGSISAGTEFQQSGSTILIGDSTLFNLFVGFNAGAANTTGSENTAIGSLALNANTIGTNNNAYGHNSLLVNTEGSSNVGFGTNTLKTNTTGSDNVAIGDGALFFNVVGDRNTAIGELSGFNVISATTTGDNVFVGYNSGAGITTGVQNTILGANVTGLSATLSNNVILADGAGVTRLQFDSSGDGTIGGALTVSGNLTIDTNTLFVDSTNNRVGVTEDDPQVELDVTGDLYADGIHSPFGGSGRIQNLLAYSEDLSQSSIWTDPLSATTVTSDNATAPNGETTADTVTWDGVSALGLRHTGITLIASTEYTLSFWAQQVSGAGDLSFDLADGPASVVAIDATLKRYVTQITSSSGSPSSMDVQLTDTSGVINFWGFQLVLGSEPMPYVRTEANSHDQDIFGETVAGFLRVNSGEGDPNGSETGTGGDIFGNVNGALSNLFFSKEATTGTEWQPVSILPTSVNQLFSTAEYEALGTASVITTTGTRSLRFHASVVSSTRHVISSQASELQFIDPTEGNQMIYTGSTAFITATAGGDITLRNAALIAAISGTPLFDYVGEGDLPGVDINEVVQSANLAQWDLGSIGRVSTGEAGPIIRFKDTNIISTTDPLILDSCVIVEITSCLFDDTANTGSGGPLFSIKDSSYKEGRAVFLTNGGRLYSGESLVRIDAGLPSTYRVEVIDSLFIVDSGGSIFDTSGSTGAFTVVADNSISATTITGVTDSSGVASFTVASAPLLGSLAIVSGFTTNTSYNTTGIVTARTATTFEIDYVAFGTSEAGSYLVTGVTVTATAHGQTIGTGVTLDTTDSTSYDGGFLIYNIQTNSFDVPGTFTQTEAGTWSTEGLDQTDPRVRAFNNPETADSHAIAGGFVNDNSTATGTIVNNTFTDMVFGTAGSALNEISTTERWKQIDDVSGVFEFKGLDPFDGLITFDFTVESTGGTVDFRFKWQKSTDGGSSFSDLADAVEALVAVGSDAQSVTKTFPLEMSEGDQIKPRITRNSGSSGITSTYASVYITNPA